MEVEGKELGDYWEDLEYSEKNAAFVNDDGWGAFLIEPMGGLKKN